MVDVSLPTGITFKSVTVTYTGGSGGDSAASVTTNQGTSTNPLFGNFVVAPDGSVVLTLVANVDCNASTGTYNASVQVYYFDPTRNVNPLQRISPSPNVFPFPTSLSVTLSYEAGGRVLGTNYNGLLSTAEDIKVVRPGINARSTVFIGESVELNPINVPLLITPLWMKPDGSSLASRQLVLNNADPSMDGTYVLQVVTNSCLLTTSTHNKGQR